MACLTPNGWSSGRRSSGESGAWGLGRKRGSMRIEELIQPFADLSQRSCRHGHVARYAVAEDRLTENSIR